jgi:hypothetical protein
VEVYAPRGAEISELVSHARAAANGLQHLRSIFVPEDEICFHLFTAPTLAASASNPTLGRLVEVVEEPPSRDLDRREQAITLELGRRGSQS